MHYMNTVLDEVHFIERIYTIKKTQRIHCTEIELRGKLGFKKIANSFRLLQVSVTKIKRGHRAIE